MTENQLTPFRGGLTDQERRHVATAVGLYCDELAKVHKSEERAGLTVQAAQTMARLDGLRAEIVEPAQEGQDWVLYERHRRDVERGLEKAVKSLGDLDAGLGPWGHVAKVVETRVALGVVAQAIKTRLAPLFKEQVELGLEGFTGKVLEHGAASMEITRGADGMPVVEVEVAE